MNTFKMQKTEYRVDNNGGYVMSEKVYKTMKTVGAWNIVFGVLLIVAGVTIGVIQLVHGGKLLKEKKEILF